MKAQTIVTKTREFIFLQTRSKSGQTVLFYYAVQTHGGKINASQTTLNSVVRKDFSRIVTLFNGSLICVVLLSSMTPV